MWKWVRRVGVAIGIVTTVLGLIQIPEQLGQWRDFMVATGMTGEPGRWTLVLAGIFIIFISSDTHRKLLRWINPRPDDIDRAEQMAALFWPKESLIKNLFRKIMPRWLTPQDSSPVKSISPTPGDPITVVMGDSIFKATQGTVSNQAVSATIISPGRIEVRSILRENERKEKRLALLELRKEGVELHNQRILTPAQYEPWHQQFENWHLRILEAANELDPELRAILSPLRDVPSWDCGWPINRDHRLAQNMIWEMLNRLEKYLERTRP